MPPGRADPIERHQQYWPETFDALVMPLVVALHGAFEAQRGQGDAVLEKYRLTPAEFDVLAALRRSPFPYALTPSEIQQGLIITSGGLAKVLQLLEARGLVSRSTSTTDRRSKPVHLSTHATTLIENAMDELVGITSKAYNGILSEAEIKELTRLLKLAGASFGQARHP